MKKRTRWKLMDVHTHILPGIDDGAEDMREAMEMMQQADKEGVCVVIATPHYGMRNPDYQRDEAMRILEEVRAETRRRYPHMKLYMGNELYYSPGIIEDLKSGKAMTIGNTDYALVEFSINASYEEITSAVRSFAREGYRPILAHVERYQCLYKQPELVEELVELGAYMQVNTRGFLLGGKLDKRGAWCKSLLQKGMIHFVASDCHSAKARAPVMESAIVEMIKIAGEDEVKRIVNTNIIKLIRNEYI